MFSQVWNGGFFLGLLIFLGALAGTFFLDLDYFIHAYFIKPEDPFSTQLRDYVKSKDIIGALNYIIFHGNDIKNKTLNSAFFQVCLSIFSLYASSSNVSPFFKVMIISILLNSIYRFIYFYIQKEHEDWFWILKKNPGPIAILIYNLIIFVFIGLSILYYR
jgi:hypothetical protein